MRHQPQPKWLVKAREKGFLMSRGRKSAKARAEKIWQRDCLRRRAPFIVATVGYRGSDGWLWAEFIGDWWLSRKLWLGLKNHFSELTLEQFGNSLRIYDIPSQALESTTERFLTFLYLHRPTIEEAFDLPPVLVRGYARCISAYAMEHCMTEGELYYIREIPNRMGHVLVLRPGDMPLVGVHLDRFELVPDGDNETSTETSD